MSSSILVPEKRQIGTINIKNLTTGGEEIRVQNTHPDYYFLFSSKKLNEFGTELKREKRELIEFILDQGRYVSLTTFFSLEELNRKIKSAYNTINKRKSTKPRIDYKKLSYDFDIKYEVVTKQAMINSFIMDYELKNKVIEMNDLTEVKDGHLKKVDIFALYHSRRIYLDILYKNQNRNRTDIYFSRTLLNDMSNVSDDYQIVNDILELEKQPGLHRLVVKIGFMQKMIPLRELRRKVFDTRDKNNNSVSFVLSLGDSALECHGVRYYDDKDEDELEDEDNWKDAVAVAYNLLDYNNNHRVVIARPPTIDHLEHLLKEKMGDGWYNLDNRTLQPFNKDEEFVHSYENRIKYEDNNSSIVGKVQVGVSGINKFEKKVLKQIYSKRHLKDSSFKYDDDERGIHIDSHYQLKRYEHFDDSEIKELIDALKEIDGRQSIMNIEYDIRNDVNLKYILHKDSNELFYLKLALEDTPISVEDFLDEIEYEAYLEIIGYLENKFKDITKKKITALKNVISGLHLTYEQEEEMGKYLSDELDEIDKVSSERNFNFNRKHRNYFSQTEGVLEPNGIPGVTHWTNAKKLLSITTIKRMREENRGIYYEFNGLDDKKQPTYIIKKKESFTDKGLHLRKVFHLLDLNGEEVRFKPSPSSFNNLVIPRWFFDILKPQKTEFGMPGWFSINVPAPQKERRPKCVISKVKDAYGKCTSNGKIIIDLDKILNKHSSKELAVANTLTHELAHFERNIFGTRYAQQKDYEEYIANSVAINVCEEIFGTALQRAYTQRNNFFNQHTNKIGSTYLPRTDKLINDLSNKIISKYGIRKTTETLLGMRNIPCNIQKPKEESKPNKVYLFKRIVEEVHREHNKKQAAKMIAAYAPYLPKGILEEVIGTPEDYKVPTTKKDEVIKMSDDMYKVTKNGFTFYAKGNIEALDYPSVSFAGIRKPQPKTVKFIKDTVKELSDEYVIISGLALGCDAIAHDACLKNNGITIAVLPTGFNHIVPAENKELAQRILNNGGLLISEYPPEARQAKYLERNRIIAGLSHTVIICEAGNGTMNTFRHAKTMGKNILAQRINTSNNNSLFELGARMYTREWVI